ncbi:MAG: YggT family protein [Anaerolineae bacterium]
MLLSVINLIFNFLTIMVFARVIISWVRVSPYHPTWGPVVNFIYQVTEPIMAPVRNLLPPMGGLDFSPIIVLLGLSFLQRILISLLVI